MLRLVFAPAGSSSRPATKPAARTAAVWSARRGLSRLPDPHNVSDQLDPATSARIVSRLEARGQDRVFQSLFRGYFPELRQCTNVLELGCGTGVVLRALLRDAEFTGKATGADLSPAFLETARELATAEGCDPNRLRFMLADAQNEGSVGADAGFDAVVMHTLISHTSDPGAVLRQAARLAAPGALLVVMDGDYGSLTYANPIDPELGRRMDAALVSAIFAQPNAMRGLAQMLPPAGWRLEEARSQCVSEVGGEASYWVSFAEGYLPRVVEAGLVDQATADQWWEGQKANLASGHFFAAANYYTFLARLAST